jgi:hypothetical protein
MRAFAFLLAMAVGAPVVAAPKVVTLELTLTDNLGFRRGPNREWTAVGQPHVTTWFVRMPAAWLDGKKLTAQAEDFFFAQLYGGPGWKNGNDDGSRYMPQEVKVRVIDAKEAAGKPWTAKRQQLAVYAPDGKVTKEGPLPEAKQPVHFDGSK